MEVASCVSSPTQPFWHNVSAVVPMPREYLQLTKSAARLARTSWWKVSAPCSWKDEGMVGGTRVRKYRTRRLRENLLLPDLTQIKLKYHYAKVIDCKWLSSFDEAPFQNLSFGFKYLHDRRKIVNLTDSFKLTLMICSSSCIVNYSFTELDEHLIKQSINHQYLPYHTLN